MSGHSEDPVAEESKRFLHFLIYPCFLLPLPALKLLSFMFRTFDGASIIGVLLCHIVCQISSGMTWFMHLRWDKILNTILFLMGLVIAVFTYFAVIYMADDPPVVEEFVVSPLEQEWKAEKDYQKGDYVKHENVFYVSNSGAKFVNLSVPGEKIRNSGKK